MSGIRIEGSSSVPFAGSHVDVGSGHVYTDANGERYIAFSSYYSKTAYKAVRPVAVPSVGGGDWHFEPATGAGQRGVTGGSGLNTVGLYVKTWGKLTTINSTTFTLTDSAGRDVRCTVTGSLTWDAAWQWVTVTGVVGLYLRCCRGRLRSLAQC